MRAQGLSESAGVRKGGGLAGERPTAVRPAATVVLVRRSPELEVFWVRRGEELRFAGGFYAFPGGRVDVADAALPLANAEGIPAAEAACLAAAARELFEETGVLLVPGAARVPEDARRKAREDLLRREEPRAEQARIALCSSRGWLSCSVSFCKKEEETTEPQSPGDNRTRTLA